VVTIALSTADPAQLPVDALVVGMASGPGRRPVPLPGSESIAGALGSDLGELLAAVGATGRRDDLHRITTLGRVAPAMLVAVGTGRLPDTGVRYGTETLRRAAGTASRALAGTRTVGFLLPEANGRPGPAEVRAVAEGVLLGNYRFAHYRSAIAHDDDEYDRLPVEEATLLGADPDDAQLRDAVAAAEAVARGVALCRDLVNTPAMDLHPEDLAAAAVSSCEPLGLSVDVMDERALAEGGYGGILGVGQGAQHPPRLVRIGYQVDPAAPTIAFAGKGVTFDSGGLSLKPPESMQTMKCDMAGAAAVLGTMVAVGERRPPVNVTGWLPTAENMPGGAAIRPSDILRMYGGRTVEVLNTDAEGRLVLADALARAAEDKPDVLIDTATLTGAQVVALGSRTIGVMGNDPGLRDALVAAADRAGELAWPMPLPGHLRKTLNTPMADLRNIGDRGNGGMLTAALFLREFVPMGMRWAHLDIAGPAFNEEPPYGYTPRGATGAAVRTFVEFVDSYAASALAATR
jgi:leucyl aminopeptidase